MGHVGQRLAREGGRIVGHAVGIGCHLVGSEIVDAAACDMLNLSLFHLHLVALGVAVLGVEDDLCEIVLEGEVDGMMLIGAGAGRRLSQRFGHNEILLMGKLLGGGHLDVLVIIQFDVAHEARGVNIAIVLRRVVGIEVQRIVGPDVLICALPYVHPLGEDDILEIDAVVADGRHLE